VVARPECADDLSSHGHRRLTVLDQEEADAAFSLDDDRLPLFEAALAQHLRQALEVPIPDAGEQRDRLEALGDVGHGGGF
jgi:hypothetical protein